MRIASWIFVLCALAGATGVFLPAAEVRVAGVSFGKRASLSLYAANRDRDLVRRLLASYGHNRGRLGQALAAAMLPRVRDHAREYVEDAKSAMASLDDVTDDDITMLGRILSATVWAFLALQIIMAALVFGDTMRGTYRRRRIIAAIVIAVVVTAVAIAIHLVLREAVWEANDDLGRDALVLGVGAYVIPMTAVAGLAAIVTMLVLEVRSATPRDSV